MAFEPAYLSLLRSGELEGRVDQALRRLEACDICPRECGVNRRESAKGAVCRTGERALVSSYSPHFGEESPLVGLGGSGTIFFAWCNLKCQYCQNSDISQLGQGHEVEAEEVATMMLRLQAMGCHNINFVSPTHVVPQILAAVLIAARTGLRVPDMKYSDGAQALRLSKVKDYPDINRAAVTEMHRQVGDLLIDERGIAQRGLLVRHLVLPAGLAGTAEIVRFLAQEISTDTYLNIMDQYRPCYRANEFPELRRGISSGEYSEALRLARSAGLQRLDQRGPSVLHWL
jgi:putative pyruvate formate lyase activating enzyme